MKEIKRPTTIPRRDLVMADTSYDQISQTNGLDSKKLKQFTYPGFNLPMHYLPNQQNINMVEPYFIISLLLSISKYILPLQQTSPISLFIHTN